jgi:hypothetical protein
VSICSFGKSEENLMAGFYKLFTDYLDEQNVKTSTATAFEASVLMRKVLKIQFFCLTWVPPNLLMLAG